MNINELTAIARELANTSGPPAGYVECPKKCGRWTMRDYGIEQTPCWTCIGCPSDAMRDWTPPIAAPATPVERRKVEVGQRYHHDIPSVTWQGEVVAIRGDKAQIKWHGSVCNDPVWWSLAEMEKLTLISIAPSMPAMGVPHPSACFCSQCQLPLTDAPADPSGCVCPHGPHTTDGKCPVHVTGGFVTNGFVGCACAKCSTPADPPCCGLICGGKDGHAPWCAKRLNTKAPPAQEAPKAAPVCTNGRDCLAPSAPVLERVLRDERQPMCDRCYLDLEANLGKMMRGETTCTPYKGPERINRALAVDWVEDCLPGEDGR